MKTIKPMQVDQVKLEELMPGMITADGVILQISVFNHCYYTPLGPVEVESADQTVAVFAKLENGMLGVIREAMIEVGRELPA